MIGAKLPFKAVRGMLKRGRHHARVGYDQIEGFSLGGEFASTSPDALQIRQVELDQFKASAVLRPVLYDLCGSSCGLLQIPGRTHDVCAMRRQRTRRFYPD